MSLPIRPRKPGVRRWAMSRQIRRWATTTTTLSRTGTTRAWTGTRRTCSVRVCCTLCHSDPGGKFLHHGITGQVFGGWEVGTVIRARLWLSPDVYFQRYRIQFAWEHGCRRPGKAVRQAEEDREWELLVRSHRVCCFAGEPQ